MKTSVYKVSLLLIAALVLAFLIITIRGQCEIANNPLSPDIPGLSYEKFLSNAKSRVVSRVILYPKRQFWVSVDNSGRHLIVPKDPASVPTLVQLLEEYDVDVILANPKRDRIPNYCPQ